MYFWRITFFNKFVRVYNRHSECNRKSCPPYTRLQAEYRKKPISAFTSYARRICTQNCREHLLSWRCNLFSSPFDVRAFIHLHRENHITHISSRKKIRRFISIEGGLDYIECVESSLKMRWCIECRSIKYFTSHRRSLRRMRIRLKKLTEFINSGDFIMPFTLFQQTTLTSLKASIFPLLFDNPSLNFCC